MSEPTAYSTTETTTLTRAVSPEDFSPDSDLTEAATPPPDTDHIRPPVTFKGKPLWPFTYGTEMFLLQIKTTGEDTAAYEALAFIFIHVRRGIADSFDLDRPELFDLCWNIAAFRREMFRWIESERITLQDRAEARRIYSEAMTKDLASEVEPVKKNPTPTTEAASSPITSTSSSGS